MIVTLTSFDYLESVCWIRGRPDGDALATLATPLLCLFTGKAHISADCLSLRCK